MPRHKMIVLSNAIAGDEIEFARWYDEEHIPDMCQVPGVLAGERFTLATADGKWSNLVIYELESDDLDGLMADVRSRSGTPRLRPTTTMDRDNAFIGLFTPVSG